MHEVHANLVVGGIEACSYGGSGRAVVHACKHPCHQRRVGYTGNLPSSHPEYLVAPRGNHLFLNMVDMDQKLQHRFTGPILRAALDFIATQVGARTVIVHCNHGYSRSPTIAMLYLAKRAGVLSHTAFDEAAEAFKQLYPAYAPGPGVTAYLLDHWHDIR